VQRGNWNAKENPRWISKHLGFSGCSNSRV
jgi:hypothetical protein